MRQPCTARAWLLLSPDVSPLVTRGMGCLVAGPWNWCCLRGIWFPRAQKMILIKASGFQTISKQRVWLENKAGKLYATPPTPFHAVVVGPNLPFSAQSDPFDSASAGAQLGSCATGHMKAWWQWWPPRCHMVPLSIPASKCTSRPAQNMALWWRRAASRHRAHTLLQPRLIRAKALAGCTGTLVPR